VTFILLFKAASQIASFNFFPPVRLEVRVAAKVSPHPIGLTNFSAL